MRILVVPDIHLLPKSPAHRTTDYLGKTLSVLDDLIQLIKDQEVQCVIFTGDIFDRSFKTVNLNYIADIIEKFKSINEICEGYVFSVLGNHEQTYYDSNPFYCIADISKSEYVKELLKDKYLPSLIAPYIQVVDRLEFPNLDIHLFHYNKYTKTYITDLNSNKENIGIYHDDLITFESEQLLYHHRIGKGISVVNTNIFDNIKLAILGHIHTPLLPFEINNTTVICSGCLIPRTVAERHTSVSLPLIDVEEEVTVSLVQFEIQNLSDTIVQESVNNAQKKYKANKVFKMVKQIASTQLYDDMLATLQPSVVKIINDASSPLNIKDYIN